MKHKMSWLIALLLPVIIFFLYAYKTINEINIYLLLNDYIKANFERCEIKNDKRNKCDVVAFYHFKIDDKIFTNRYLFKKKFLNSITAKEYIENFSKNDLTIWFNTKNPNISSIEKKFPIKNCVYITIVFAVFIYFLILKYYVYSFQKID